LEGSRLSYPRCLEFRFRGRGDDRFGSFGHGACDGYVEFGGGMFAGRSPRCDQYEFGRGRNFES
jgi:hypothetical protein